MNLAYTFNNKRVFYKQIGLGELSTKILCIFMILLLAVVLIFAATIYEPNYYRKNVDVIGLRGNINKLMYASLILEATRKTGENKLIKPFGGLSYVEVDQLDNSLQKSFLNSKDGNIENMGIMSLNTVFFRQMFKDLNLGSLFKDNNLNHYVVITKGNKAGTILYNGPMKFIGENNRQYFGLEQSIHFSYKDE